MENMTTASKKNLVSFAGTRPSRAGAVLSDAHVLEARHTFERGWFEEIGVDPVNLELFGGGDTGSPTGSKAPHHLDDDIEDNAGEF